MLHQAGSGLVKPGRAVLAMAHDDLLEDGSSPAATPRLKEGRCLPRSHHHPPPLRCVCRPDRYLASGHSATLACIDGGCRSM